jgi:hypothetical protein
MSEHEGDARRAVERREAAAPATLTWPKGLALLLAAGALWFLSVTATTIFLDLFGRP